LRTLQMPKLLFFHSEDWAFLRHFMPMARAAQAAGFEVAVAVRVRNDAHRLEAAGCRVVPLEAERGSLGPLEIMGSVARMVRIVKAERPDVVQCIALRTVVLGGLAARLAGAPRLVLTPTGTHRPAARTIFNRACAAWSPHPLRVREQRGSG
jgi:hypothetical protein